jgi:hypothetical protein
MRTLPWCPSVLPASPECCVRRASRPSILPIARASLLKQQNIARDALGGCEVTSRLLDAPRAYDLTPNAVPRRHPLYQAPTHPTYTTRQALLFFDVRIALVNPTGAATIFTKVAPSAFSARVCVHRSWDVHTTAVCSAYTSVPSSHTPLSSPPAHGHCHSPPSTPAPLVHYLYHHPAPAAHPRARGAPAAAVPHCRLRTDRHQAHHSRLPPDSALSSRRLRLGASPAGLHQCPALVRSAVSPHRRATRCLSARCDVLGTLPL